MKLILDVKVKEEDLNTELSWRFVRIGPAV